jgi:hypothetical protein
MPAPMPREPPMTRAVFRRNETMGSMSEAIALFLTQRYGRQEV